MARISDYPLRIFLRGSTLEISVGVGTIAEAAQQGETDGKDFANGHLKIISQRQFAKDVLFQLLYEDDAGLTLVHKMLDEAIHHAIEEGSTGLQYG